MAIRKLGCDPRVRIGSLENITLSVGGDLVSDRCTRADEGSRRGYLLKTIGYILSLQRKGWGEVLLHSQPIWPDDREILSFAGELEVCVQGAIRILTILCRGKDEESLIWIQGEIRKGPFIQVCCVVSEEPALQINRDSALIEKLDPVFIVAILITDAALVRCHEFGNYERLGEGGKGGSGDDGYGNRGCHEAVKGCHKMGRGYPV